VVEIYLDIVIICLDDRRGYITRHESFSSVKALLDDGFFHGKLVLSQMFNKDIGLLFK